MTTMEQAWTDGTRLKLVDHGQLSTLTLLNPAGMGAMVMAPVAELVSVLRFVATTGEGDYSHRDWTVEWRGTEDYGVEIAAEIRGGGGVVELVGMVASQEDTIDLVHRLDLFVTELAGRRA